MRHFNNSHFTDKMNHIAGIFLGVVEYVSDEQEFLRVKVRCPSLGDTYDKPVKDLLWAQVCSPFVGSLDNSSSLNAGGHKMHGFIAPPTVGSLAVVTALDEDAQILICLGFLPNNLDALRTYPQGRYESSSAGPFDDNGVPLQPLAGGLDRIFGPAADTNHERKTRGTETQISAKIGDENTDDSVTEINLPGGSKMLLKPGYNNDRPTVYGFVTPDGHCLVLNDHDTNSHVKLQTSGGAQILLDDTNERLYINSGFGNSWMEMDYDGNVDIYCYNYNIHASNNVNITADNSFNIIGKEDFNITSLEDLKITSSKTTHMLSQNLRYTTTEDIFVVGRNMNTALTNANNIQCDTLNLSVTSDIKTQAAAIYLKGSSTVDIKGGTIHLNSPTPVQTPSDTISSSALRAYWTTRVPEHEPWGRQSFIATTTSHDDIYLNFDYDDPKVGREDVSNLPGGTRGVFWRR